MSFDPTPSQALLLFGLLARHGEAAQAELMPAVTKADREALASAKLVGVEKAGGSFHLELTDQGWAWVATNLSADLPPAQGGLHEMLKRLDDHLGRRGGTLADFIGSKPAAKPKPAARRKPAAKRETTKTVAAKPKTLSATALRKRIEAAYLAITEGRKNESVSLARLRAELADLDRAVVDAGLGRILAGDKKASLMRHDDPHQIDQANRVAAFHSGGEPFHVLWIAS